MIWNLLWIVSSKNMQKRETIKKVLNFDFKKKYSYISKLNIYDLGSIF